MTSEIEKNNNNENYKMEIVNNTKIKMLNNSVKINNYNGDDDDNIQFDNGDRMSLKIDLSMAEQFYYEVISSFEQEEVFKKN